MSALRISFRRRHCPITRLPRLSELHASFRAEGASR